MTTMFILQALVVIAAIVIGAKLGGAGLGMAGGLGPFRFNVCFRIKTCITSGGCDVNYYGSCDGCCDFASR